MRVVLWLLAMVLALLPVTANAAGPVRRIHVDAGARTPSLVQLLREEGGVEITAADAAEVQVVLRTAGASWTLEVRDRKGARILRRDIGAAGGDLAALRVAALLVEKALSGRSIEPPVAPVRTGTIAPVRGSSLASARRGDPLAGVRALPSVPVAPTAASLIASASALPRTGTGTTAAIAAAGDDQDTPDGPRLGARRRKAARGEVAAAEKAVADQAAVDKVATDRAATDRAAADESAAEKGAADKPSADKAAADKGAADKAVADKGAADKASADKGAAAQAAADQAAAERATAGDPPDQATRDAAAETASTDAAATRRDRPPLAPDDSGELASDPRGDRDRAAFDRSEVGPSIEDGPILGIQSFPDAERRWRFVLSLAARWWGVPSDIPQLGFGLGAEHPVGPVYLGASFRVAGVGCCQRTAVGLIADVQEVGGAVYTLVPLVRWGEDAILVASGEVAADAMLGTASLDPSFGSAGTPADLQGFSLTAGIGPALEVRLFEQLALRLRASIRASLAVYEIQGAQLAGDPIHSGWVHPYIDVAIPIGL